MSEDVHENRGNRESLDDVLLTALATGATAKQAAEFASVSDKTVYRRMADPEFMRRLRELRSQTLDAVLGRLTFAAAGAVETLRKLLESKSDTVKLGAARAILEHCGKLRSDIDVEARLAAIERQLEQRDER